MREIPPGSLTRIMRVPFLDLPAQYQSIKEDIDAAMAEVVDACAFIGGQALREFESAFSAFQSVEQCVGVGNGTDALEIVFEALDIPSGSEIIVPANTFIATAEAVTRTGHKVVFCDCDEANMTIDVGDAENCISEKTAAIVAVHLYGHPCDMDPLLSLARQHDLAIIEDCAQAHGAEYKGRRVGGIGQAGTFSFFPGKNLGAFGDAGAITTNSGQFAERCRRIANHGRLEKFDHEIVGRNSRLDNLQAAVLAVKLRHLEKWTEHRIRIADRYLSGLTDCSGVQLPGRADWARQVYHLFVIRCDARNELQAFLADHGVSSGIHYPMAIPKMAAYASLEQATESLRANREDSRLLSLPIGEHVDAEACDYVCMKIREFFHS